MVMNKKISLILIVILLIATGLIVTKIQDVKEIEPQVKDEKTGLGVPVKVAQIKAGAITKTIDYTGQVELSKEIRISSLVGGQVKKVAVKVGEEVKEGQVLVQLDKTELQLAVDSAKKAVKQSKVKLRQTRLNLNNLTQERTELNLSLEQARVSLQEVEAKLAEAQANLQRVKAEYKRKKRLYDNQIISQAKFDVSKARYKSAVAKVEQLEAKIEGGEIKLKKLKVKLEQLAIRKKILQENLKQTQLGVELAHNKLQQAQNKLGYATITAPQRGIILKKIITEGEIATPGRPLLNLGVADQVKVKIAVGDQTLKLLKVGTPAKVTFASLPQQVFRAQVTKVYPVVNQVGLTKVELALNNSNFQLRKGMSAQVELITKSHKKTLLAPKEAIYTSQGQTYLYLIKNDKAMRKQVILGISNGTQVEILTDIAPGTRVATTNHLQLKDGSQVYIWSKEGQKK
ncbi:RND family efflux transporter, MFP subunit [Halobacteroides halobius DSM 5150]|uniref:RND family efflux transporter, MFP subunit n=1 Tax=Halobacteroides halobius (strain ATCC 35273 / DSM 5150 / MD-1) TaxID=748449 RepID=L0K826_HALHC|nr:efflux RND transporter periplasmic adaptor subunit [Halobacteroides halobius]AGB41176.1 RND family efflux transporter, MFP subunit [Halobacteroides halobius DSM 5150]